MTVIMPTLEFLEVYATCPFCQSLQLIKMVIKTPAGCSDSYADISGGFQRCTGCNGALTYTKVFGYPEEGDDWPISKFKKENKNVDGQRERRENTQEQDHRPEG